MELDIYKYDDFRQYLRDAFEARKKADPSFTHRQFAELAKVKNPGTLLHVIQGKRALSAKVCETCIQVFGLKSVAAEFFRILVDYKQEKDPETKDNLWRELQNRRSHSSFVRLNTAQVRYYGDTAYALVLGAIEATDFRGRYEELASFLNPPLPLVKVKKCIRDLCDWQLLRQDPLGQYHVVSRFIEPPATLKDPVRLLNREWIHHAADALLKIPSNERHMSTSILAVSEATRGKILERIEAMRREIFELAASDSHAETVMQLSVQFFPKSNSKRRKA